jgi:hypothetical protein
VSASAEALIQRSTNLLHAPRRFVNVVGNVGLDAITRRATSPVKPLGRVMRPPLVATRLAAVVSLIRLLLAGRQILAFIDHVVSLVAVIVAGIVPPHGGNAPVCDSLVFESVTVSPESGSKQSSLVLLLDPYSAIE